MVGLEGCVLVDERWDDLLWLCRTGQDVVKGAFMKYWFTSVALLTNPRMRLHAKFARELLQNVSAWSYNRFHMLDIFHPL